MKFKKGTTVRCKKEILARCSKSVAKLLNGNGVVIVEGATYAKVLFSNSKDYWLSNRALDLVKNQQLLFDFYTE